MKISIISDTHFDMHRLVGKRATIDLDMFSNSEGADALFIAGDLVEWRGILSAKLALDYITSHYPTVFIVFGNHEAYSGAYYQSRHDMKSWLETNYPMIVVLDDDVTEYGGVTIVGSTLWTDFNKNNPITILRCNKEMNDYHLVKNERPNWPDWLTFADSLPKMQAKDTYGIHQRSKEFLFGAVDAAAGPVVVMTHHAPSSYSIPPEYARDTHLNGAYFSSLENEIMDRPVIRLWIHGHVHSEFDYMIGNTRVVCNPLGYPHAVNPEFWVKTLDV